MIPYIPIVGLLTRDWLPYIHIHDRYTSHGSHPYTFQLSASAVKQRQPYSQSVVQDQRQRLGASHTQHWRKDNSSLGKMDNEKIE